MDTHEGSSPGWDALDAALAARFGDQEPHHWAIQDEPEAGGLAAISAYRVDGGWCYVTFGFSELGEKESDDESVSGWGFELTLRLRSGAPEPPEWPLDLLAGLGEYVFAETAPFAPGHLLDAGGPVTGGTPRTRLTGIAFLEDPELRSVVTPNGEVTFLCAVGVTDDELQRLRPASPNEIAERVRGRDRELWTDPRR